MADLLEAEGRALRDSARAEGRLLKQQMAKFSLGTAVLLVAAPLAFVGLCLLFVSVFLSLNSRIGPAGAAAITGAMTLAAVGVLLWIFKTLTR